MLALLGKRDYPTDGIEDYCANLSAAFEKLGHEMCLKRVPWAEEGWAGGLASVWRMGRRYKDQWALVQYTSLSWSRRGFPLGFLATVMLLKLRGVRLAIVFHDPQQFAGARLIDRIRRACQTFVMRSAFRLAEACILPVPLEKAAWLPAPHAKAAFVPIGANVPALGACATASRSGDGAKTIAVFTLTDGGDITREISDLALAARKAAERVARVRLITVGRGSIEAKSRLQHALADAPVELHALGIIPAQEVARVLADADVSLFVRAPLSTQRGSAIASIVNAVPLVAYAEGSLPAVFAEAGVVGVRYADGDELAAATVKVLTDNSWRLELHQRSRSAYRKYFAWDAVAAQCIDLLEHA
jgi:hypothetical protein